MKQLILLVVITALAGCGGVHKAKRSAKNTPVATAPAPVALPYASGPINSACMGSDRKARSRALCGCIQAVADKTLNRGQQRIAISFYKDPQKAQDIRQSDRSSDEEFWDAYRNYGETAERVCR